MELALWMSKYYITPLGVVLDSVIPSAVKKQVGIGYSRMVALAKPREEVQAILEKTRAPKRRAILARLMLLEGGAAVHQSAWEEDLVDYVQLYVAPVTLGNHGPALLEGHTFGLTALHEQRVRTLGPDVLIEGYVHRPD